MKAKYGLLLLILLLTSCSEEIINKPYGSNDGKAPGIVEVVDYTPIPGGVILQVRNPSDEDLLYIKAKYQLDSGRNGREDIRLLKHNNSGRLWKCFREKHHTFCRRSYGE